MITAAISALKERNGSSKRAIAKYIETHYANLPPTHSALLTHHLKRLKINGQIPLLLGPRDGLAGLRSPSPKQVKLPCPFLLNVDINSVPGQPQQNVAVGPGTVYVDVGPVNGPAAGGPVRGRGRPPKQGGFKRGPGRPPKNGVATAAGGVGMGERGRPKKNAAPERPYKRAKGGHGEGRLGQLMWSKGWLQGRLLVVGWWRHLLLMLMRLELVVELAQWLASVGGGRPRPMVGRRSRGMTSVPRSKKLSGKPWAGLKR
ncbi:UNVERIFIED_CONTAM: hypothetical protein Slati_0303800 [Sesamum latifolium]|uniref:H15 domain-containing protein n=1 Tax=Sesamum latifolium TaxID=2727402 RepID=A0AAW2YE85_9LAMI